MFHHCSEPFSPPIVNKLAQIFQTGGQCLEAGGVIPSIIIPKEAFITSCRRIEKQVLYWFCKQGFDGEIDNKTPPHFYPLMTSGYPWLLERLVDLLDLYEKQQTQTAQQQILEWIEQNHTIKDENRKKAVLASTRQEHERLPTLEQVIGSEEAIYNLYDAVVHDDDGYPKCRIADGTPDLFLWHPNIDLHLWFFAEIKGPGDSLRKTQAVWLQEHWEKIEGRFLIVHVL